MGDHTTTIVQVLPALESGGVERGTLEIGRAIVEAGWRSVVVSGGGRLVDQLEAEGSEHVTWDLGRKSLLTLRQIRPFRRFLRELHPDILHVRSRMPAWMTWLAWRGLPKQQRPRFVTTVHGPYSVNAYSKIMTRGERVIAVSNMIRRYILDNYQEVDPACIRVIHRGIKPEDHPRDHRPSSEWHTAFRQDLPGVNPNTKLITIPARITRWKGQLAGVDVLAQLLQRGHDVALLLVGEVKDGKDGFRHELKMRAESLGVQDRVIFLGHRNDIREILSASDISLSLTEKPEAFGRVIVESLSLGTPVVAYNHGGAAEQLEVMLPSGRVPVGDLKRAAEAVASFLETPPTIATEHPFTLDQMQRSTLGVYEELLSQTRVQEPSGLT